MKLLSVIFLVLMVFAVSTSKFRSTSKSILLSPYEIPDPVFSILPNRNQLTNAINQGNSQKLAVIIEIINEKKDLIQCQNIILYYNEILGLTRQQHLNKTKLIKSLQTIQAESKLKRNILVEENGIIQQQIWNLGIRQIESHLMNKNEQLKKERSKQEKHQAQITAKNQELQEHESSISKLMEEETEYVDSTQQKEIILLTLNEQIQYLESHLQTLHEKRDQTQKTITKNKQKLSEIRTMIFNSRQSIWLIEQEILEIKNTMKQIATSIVDLEVQLERIHHEYKSTLKKVAKFKQKIAQNTQFMDQSQEMERSKLLVKLKEIVQTLNQFDITITNQNKHLYLQCFRIDFEQSDYLEDDEYSINGQYLPIYISTVYGNSVSLPVASSALTKTFKIVNIYGEQSKYDGYDFTCLNPSLAQSSNGIIAQVNPSNIRIISLRGENKILKIGDCSRMETDIGKLVEGQTIYYKGIQQQQEINLLFATCF